MAGRWLYRLYLNRSIVTFLHDGCVAAMSLWLALFLRVGTAAIWDTRYLELMKIGVPVFTVIALLTYRVFGMYRGVWRYASVPDLVTIVKANSLAVLVFLPFLFVMTRLETMPRTVPLIQWLVLVMWLGGTRLLYRAWRSHRLIVQDNEAFASIPVLIYGSDDEAEQFIRATEKQGNLQPIGILDDKAGRKGMTLHGIKVLGRASDLEDILQRVKHAGTQFPRKLIITGKNAVEMRGTAIRDLSELAASHGLAVVRLPKLTDVQRLDQAETLNLQPIALEDLLGRTQNVLNTYAISDMLQGCAVMVTGAGGSIGSEVALQVASFGPSALLLIDNSEHNLYQVEMRLREEGYELPLECRLADVREAEQMNRLCMDFKPHVVFHAAAYKHVPMVEANPAQGVLTNVIGTYTVAEAARKANAAAFVQISTDKAVNPTNVMGATKKLAEMMCQALDAEAGGQSTRFMTVRFGNVLGSSGSVVPLFKRQLERGGPLTITDKRIERYFMTIPEAVGLVLSASAYGLTAPKRGQIFVLDMGEPIKIDDLARHMIRLAGLRPDKDIKIIYTGLRPGEKLYEELFNEDEASTTTELPNIKAADPAHKSVAELQQAINGLQGAAVRDDVAQIKILLSQIVPNYQPYQP